MITWIRNAVRCNVEVLDLKMTLYDYEEAPLPSGVLLCESLRSLGVDMNFTILKTPSFGFSSKIKYLELRNVDIQDEGFFKWMSCYCKCIEELHLNQVQGIENITIESSSLKKFSLVDAYNICRLKISGEKLEDIRIGWHFMSPSNGSLNIFAPNLKYLQWIWNLMNRPNLGKLKCLEGAAIVLDTEADDLDNVFEVLCCLCKVKVLMLGEQTIKAPFREGSMPTPIYDICCLSLMIGSFIDELVPAMVSLFKGMPNLCTLYIKSTQRLDDSKSNTSGFNMEYWKLQNLAFIYQLKRVGIELCNESNAVELARYMLEYAPNLEKMIIGLPQNSEEVTSKLKKCQIVSSATVVFQENKKRQ